MQPSAACSHRTHKTFSFSHIFVCCTCLASVPQSIQNRVQSVQKPEQMFRIRFYLFLNLVFLFKNLTFVFWIMLCRFKDSLWTFCSETFSVCKACHNVKNHVLSVLRPDQLSFCFESCSISLETFFLFRIIRLLYLYFFCKQVLVHAFFWILFRSISLSHSLQSCLLCLEIMNMRFL